MKIFSKKIRKSHCIYNILGLKIKVRLEKTPAKGARKTGQKTIKQLDADIKKLDKKLFKGFCWSNRKDFTTEDKIRLFSQWFYLSCGYYYPNFKKPKSLNEKLNWMKFNYRNSEKLLATDKATFKEYIKDKIGEGYTVPLIKVYDDVCDIDFDELPDKFVIKTTNGGGGKQVKIIQDKSKVDLDNLKFEFSHHLSPWFEGGIFTGFFGKSKISPKIIVEEYVEQLNGQVYDYKFLCFHGEPKCLFVAVDRYTDKRFNFYDMDWNLLPFTQGPKNADYDIPKPKLFDEMVEIAKKLSAPYPFVRVDFYQVENKILVGELTFTSWSGFKEFKPVEWDYKIGEWLDLSKIPPEHLKILPEFAEAAKTFLPADVVDEHTVKVKKKTNETV